MECILGFFAYLIGAIISGALVAIIFAIIFFGTRRILHGVWDSFSDIK